jgi:DNA-binding transcriptional LysR family regulator
MIQDFLQNGKSELALGVVSAEYEKLFCSHRIAEEEMVLVVPKEHPVIEKAEARDDCNFPFIDAVHIAKESFVLPSPVLYSGRFAEKYFIDHGITPMVSMRMNLTGDVYQHIIEGNGIAMLPSVPLQAMDLEDDLAYLSLEDRTRMHTVALLCKKSHVLNPIERSLLEIIRHCYH